MAVSVAAIAGGFSCAWAQETPAANVPAGAEREAAVLGVEEIMVVARRRDERIQDVPLAVTAIQSDKLSNNGIVSVAELPLVAPYLTMSPSPGGGRSSPNFAIRGLSQQELSILGDQSVSTYIGDAVIARVQGVNGALYDVGSIEVLRGPQGTLFGRNTTGGAVIIRPNRPVLDSLEAMGAVTIGNLGTFNTEAMVNLPLHEKVSVRLAGRTLHDNGYVFDELLDRNVNFTKQQAFRASVLVQPAPELEVLTSYEYFHENDGGVGAYLGAINPDAANNAPAFRAARGYRPLEDLLAEQNERGIYRIASGTPAYVKIDTHLLTNVITYEVSDSITLKNVLGYRDVKDDLRDDLDGTESSIFPQQRIDNSWQFSEEFQILGSHDRFNWIAGLYYFKERGRLQALSNANAVDPGDIEPPTVAEYPDATFNFGDITGRNISYAAFAQGSYELLDGLNATAGIRYNKDKRSSSIKNRFPRLDLCRFSIDHDNNPATPEIVPPLDQCEVNGEASFSEVTYNLSLDYRINDDLLVYVAHRHGYRSGGLESRATTEEFLKRSYEPETVDDYEIGFKGDWRFGNTFLRTNLAAYYADYKDIQRVLTDATIIPVQSVTVNAATARIQGVEADVLFRPLAWLDLTANYAYTDAKFKDFLTPDNVDLSDSPLARAPKHVYTLGVRVTPEISPEYGEVTFGGSYYYHDSYNADDGYIAGVTEMPSYNLVNLDASWNNIMDSGFDLSATVTNLTKERYSYYVANLLGLGVLPYFAAEPRRFNLTLRYRFGD